MLADLEVGKILPPQVIVSWRIRHGHKGGLRGGRGHTPEKPLRPVAFHELHLHAVMRDPPAFEKGRDEFCVILGQFHGQFVP